MGNFLDPIRWASPRKREHAHGQCTIAVPMVSNVRRGREGNPRHPGRARRTDHNTRVMDSSCRTNEHALVQGRRPCKCRSVLVGITPAMPWNGSSCIRVKMLAAMRRPPSIVSTRKPHIFRVDDPALVSLDRDEPMRTCYTFFTFYNACESIESFRAYGLQGHLRRHWRDDPGKRFLLHVAKVKKLTRVSPLPDHVVAQEWSRELRRPCGGGAIGARAKSTTSELAIFSSTQPPTLPNRRGGNTQNMSFSRSPVGGPLHRPLLPSTLLHRPRWDCHVPHMFLVTSIPPIPSWHDVFERTSSCHTPFRKEGSWPRSGTSKSLRN
eukprot:scaffold64_cov338-Pavlova_lutheri.AAC.4